MFGLSTRDRERLAGAESRLEHVAVLLERLDVALITRDPGNVRSADAYDGLRRTVAASASDRRRMVAQLAELHDRVAGGTSIEDLASLLEEWTTQAGLVRLVTFDRPDAFDVVGSDGDDLRVVRHAWIDDVNGTVVRRGQVERMPTPAALESDLEEGPDSDQTGLADDDAGLAPAVGVPDATDSHRSLRNQEAAVEVPAAPAEGPARSGDKGAGTGGPKTTGGPNS